MRRATMDDAARSAMFTVAIGIHSMRAGTTPTRRCLHCGYVIEHLAESRCPECGRGFDPMDSKTFAIKQRPTRGWLAATVVMWIWPVLGFALVHFTWFAGWLGLGHPPRPSLDDPSSISFLVDALVLLSIVVIGLLPVGAMCGVVANLWLGRVYRVPGSRQVLLHAAFLLAWSAQIALLGIDPLQAGTWLFD